MSYKFSGFNSLQTGKPIQSLMYARPVPVPSIAVSIPFKRESLSKANIRERVSREDKKVSIPFKRESLSKVTTTISSSIPKATKLVSIPFKRESLSKEHLEESTWKIKKCFNSLQTGKPIQSKS